MTKLVYNCNLCGKRLFEYKSDEAWKFENAIVVCKECSDAMLYAATAGNPFQ